LAVTPWRVVVLAMLLVLAGCAAKSDNDSNNDQHGFYGGVSGGWHP
jgi:hypothetical protein